jgi:hypothetical protein
VSVSNEYNVYDVRFATMPRKRVNHYRHHTVDLFGPRDDDTTAIRAGNQIQLGGRVYTTVDGHQHPDYHETTSDVEDFKPVVPEVPPQLPPQRQRTSTRTNLHKPQQPPPPCPSTKSTILPSIHPPTISPPAAPTCPPQQRDSPDNDSNLYEEIDEYLNQFMPQVSVSCCSRRIVALNFLSRQYGSDTQSPRRPRVC